MRGPQRGSTVDRETSLVEVLVVADQEPFLAAARFVVGASPGFRVAGEARTGEEAVDLASSLEQTLVLMDINLPGISGIEATRRVLSAAPDTAVILMSTYQAADLPDDARTSGARAYVNKEDLARS
ncbi:MAG TPA: response regulator transcription factor [Jiangellaceae bacterium]|nr:response regulator transcription factor [Jiangellaceae bacterium]